jgi:hypothetical protein
MHLLVGPAAPSTDLPPAARHKYSTEMFSSPRPQYIGSVAGADEVALIDGMLAGFYDAPGQTAALQKFQRRVDASKGKVLRPKKIQPKGSQLGFFEQGLAIGAGLFLTLLISSVGGGIWVLRRAL